MAADLNRVTLVGRLTRDPELRNTGGGTSICRLRLAVTTRARDNNGDWADRPNYFDVTVFGRQAESVTQYLGKGRRVGVDGRLQWREWETTDGRRQSVEVVANDVFFLDTPRDTTTTSMAGGTQTPATPNPPADSDIPF